MQGRHRRRAAAAATAAFGAALLLSAAPASADCVSAEVWYQYPGQTKQYVVGPKKCVAPTPFNEGPSVGVAPDDTVVIYPGVKVWTALP